MCRPCLNAVIELAVKAKQQITPQNTLESGKMVKEYKSRPQKRRILRDIAIQEGFYRGLDPEMRNEKNVFETRKGKILDGDLQTGR